MRLLNVCLGLAILGGTAVADPQADVAAKAAADAGSARFEANDFAGAAAKFEEAYAIVRDPSYLFNIAQAYRHAGDCIRAADYYGRFLGEVPHPPNEDKIRVWYASQMQCAKERTKAPPVAPVGPTTGTGKPKSPGPTPQPETPSSGGHRGIALALAGTSLAAFAVGGVFVWDARYLGNQRNSLLARCTLAAPCSSAVVNDYDDRGSRANKLAVVGFAVGGVALAASVALLVTGHSHASSVAVAPVEGGAMVSTAWTLE